ncbi:MAG: PEP-CTERM sorting domain-containing protein [Microcoleaceae cyanobacterium]
MTISSILKNTSVAAVAVTAAFVSSVPAEALTLNGSIGLSGNASVPNGTNPLTTTIGFNQTQIDDSVGDFASILFPTSDPLELPVLSNLTLNRTSIINGSSANYQAVPTAGFINFGTQTIGGLTDQLTFDLSQANFTRFTAGANFVALNPTNVLQGVFKFGDETVANGFLSASLSGAGDSFQLTLSTEAVPEPLTILGSLSAVGIGAVLKNKQKIKA